MTDKERAEELLAALSAAFAPATDDVLRTADRTAPLGFDVTPCPVPWCDLFGRHLFDDEVPAIVTAFEGIAQVSHRRSCRHLVSKDLTDWGIAVYAEVFEDRGRVEEPCVSVETTDGPIHLGRGAVDYLASAMRKACDVAGLEHEYEEVDE